MTRQTIVSESDVRIGSPLPTPTYVRTYERTEKGGHLPEASCSSVSRAHAYGMSSGCWFHGQARLWDCGSCRDAVTE
jgi:hypothetical protein